MSAPFSVPTGDPGSLQAAARSFGAIATDLDTQITNSRSAMQTALADWVAPRADDFRNAGQALIDELAAMRTAAAMAAQLLGAYAAELQDTQSQVSGYARAYGAIKEPTGPDPTDRDEISVMKRRSAFDQLAASATGDLRTFAQHVAAALDAETGLAVGTVSTLTPAEIERKVDSTLGLTGLSLTDVLTGHVSDDTAWALLGTADGPVFSTSAPAPGDTGFQEWYAALTPAQQLLEVQKLNAAFTSGEFDPYAGVRGGALPQWATDFNATHQTMCMTDGGLPPGYGYFGGGSILGPGGSQWPIVMPYYNDGDHVYMADSGAGRDDGGIEQLDGQDPGWHTVSTYSGLGQFGSISGSTKFFTGLLVATGQELETTATDPDAVRVDGSGVPYAGGDLAELPKGPPDKPWWDVESDAMMPKPLEDLPPGSIQPNLEYNEPALGANALLIQSAQAAGAIHDEESHAQRQWYVDYQVNDDGRIRAVVHTYSAARTEEGKTYVGSFANGFPTGQGGNTAEIPYNTRYNEYTHPVMTAAPDPGVEYSGQGEPLENSVPISERLNK